MGSFLHLVPTPGNMKSNFKYCKLLFKPTQSVTSYFNIYTSRNLLILQYSMVNQLWNGSSMWKEYSCHIIWHIKASSWYLTLQETSMRDRNYTLTFRPETPINIGQFWVFYPSWKFKFLICFYQFETSDYRADRTMFCSRATLPGHTWKLVHRPIIQLHIQPDFNNTVLLSGNS